MTNHENMVPPEPYFYPELREYFSGEGIPTAALAWQTAPYRPDLVGKSRVAVAQILLPTIDEPIWLITTATYETGGELCFLPGSVTPMTASRIRVLYEGIARESFHDLTRPDKIGIEVDGFSISSSDEDGLSNTILPRLIITADSRIVWVNQPDYDD